MKRIITALTAAALLSAAVPAGAAFADVTADSTSGAYRAITELEALGIVEGDENGNFNPTSKLTRAEFTKLIVAANGETAVAEALTETRFNDCKTHWAAGYAEAGAAAGFIEGYSDTEFGPDDPVTYAQALKMLVSVLGYTQYAEAAGGWQAGYLSYAAKLGITDGISGAEADTEINREAAAYLIDRAIKVPLAVLENDSTVIHDGKSGREYETLLTSRHNAYEVTGRVAATRSTNRSLAKDEVTYNVEVSDNFDGTAYSKESYPITAKIGATNARDLLFYYSEALIQKDETNDEYTILAIWEK